MFDQQQEREYQKAVQPGSPISALLSSACQPLMVGPAGGGTICGGPTLLCKLQAAKEAAWSGRRGANERVAEPRRYQLPIRAAPKLHPNSCLARHVPPFTHSRPTPTGQTLHARILLCTSSACTRASLQHAKNTLPPPVLRPYPTAVHTSNELPPLRHPTPRQRNLVQFP